MGALADAVAEFRTALENDSVLTALKEWPVLLVYPASGNWADATQTSVRGAHTIRVALHANRDQRGLDGAIAQLLTYVDDVPRVILAAWHASRFAGTVSLLGFGGGSPPIRATWEPDEVGGINTFAIKYDIDIRIHEEGVA